MNPATGLNGSSFAEDVRNPPFAILVPHGVGGTTGIVRQPVEVLGAAFMHVHGVLMLRLVEFGVPADFGAPVLRSAVPAIALDGDFEPVAARSGGHSLRGLTGMAA